MSKVAQRLRAWTQNQAIAIVGYIPRIRAPLHHSISPLYLATESANARSGTLIARNMSTATSVDPQIVDRRDV